MCIKSKWTKQNVKGQQVKAISEIHLENITK